MARAALLAIAIAALGPGCGHHPPRGGDHPAPLDWAAAGVDWDHPPAAGPEPAWAPPRADAFTLGNGLRVLVVENHRLPLVSVRVVLDRAGGREDGAQLGLASLTADLLQEGAGDLDARAFPEAVERLGADLDVAAGTDATTVWLDTLASTFDDSIALVAQLLRAPALTDADFARVQADALADLALRAQEPRRVAALVFDREVLGGHPYGAPVTGFPATVGALRADDVRGFWRDHYAPSTATVVVAGDVDRATVEASLRAHLGDWTATAPAAAVAPPAPPVPTPTLWLVDRPGAPQCVVMIGRPGLAADDPRVITAEVVNTAIGGSFASRLNTRLREELGYTYGIYASFWRGRWAGTWAASSSLKTEHTVAGLREALALIDVARREPMPPDELHKTQQLMTRQLPQAFETDRAIAGELAGLVSDGLPADWYQGYADAVRAVTATAARDLVADAWRDLSIVVVGDRRVIGDGLAGLGLPVVIVDADGEPLEP